MTPLERLSDAQLIEKLRGLAWKIGYMEGSGHGQDPSAEHAEREAVEQELAARLASASGALQRIFDQDREEFTNNDGPFAAIAREVLYPKRNNGQ